MKAVTSTKIYDLEDLLDVIDQWRSQQETVVFTNGVFDLLHAGHLLSLEKAAEFGDRLIVGINSDESVRSLSKGPGRPVNTDIDRSRLIAGLSVVDAVVKFNESTPYHLLSRIKPDVLVKGSDYKIDEIIGREFAGRVERIALLPGFSSTDLIKKIHKLQIA